MQQIALDIGLASGPTLDNFFVGSNQAVLQHLRLWVDQRNVHSSLSPVPTYLWGDSASGKTHLLKAVQQALRDAGARVGWLDPGVQAPPDFNEQWAVLLLDDVHLYTPVQQQAAFNWFVNAQTHQRGLLAAGALPPAELPLRDDLRTRLGWGHLFSLQTLSDLERRGVLRQAADARGLFLSDEVMGFMQTRFARDLGSLMALLDRLDSYSLQTKRAATIPLIKAMMDES